MQEMPEEMKTARSLQNLLTKVSRTSCYCCTASWNRLDEYETVTVHSDIVRNAGCNASEKEVA